ncbi:hypothetical protein ACOSQ3_001734 [Xanthoceras sorbifolium]
MDKGLQLLFLVNLVLKVKHIKHEFHTKVVQDTFLILVNRKESQTTNFHSRLKHVHAKFNDINSSTMTNLINIISGRAIQCTMQLETNINIL